MVSPRDQNFFVTAGDWLRGPWWESMNRWYVKSLEPCSSKVKGEHPLPVKNTMLIPDSQKFFQCELESLRTQLQAQTKAFEFLNHSVTMLEKESCLQQIKIQQLEEVWSPLSLQGEKEGRKRAEDQSQQELHGALAQGLQELQKTLRDSEELQQARTTRCLQLLAQEIRDSKKFLWEELELVREEVTFIYQKLQAQEDEISENLLNIQKMQKTQVKCRKVLTKMKQQAYEPCSYPEAEEVLAEGNCTWKDDLQKELSNIWSAVHSLQNSIDCLALSMGTRPRASCLKGPAFAMAGGRPHLKRSFSIIPCFVFVESVLLGIVILLAYRLEFTDTFPVHTQGFFCYDSAYAKPYPGPEAASRAPPALIYALVTAGPTFTILLGELARAFFPAPPSASPVSGESTIVSGACCRFSPPLRRLVRFLGVYSFGLFTTTIFANAGQVVTGNPTPHFLSVCRPNYTALGCPPPSPDRPGPDRFVTDQSACAGSPSLVAAARRAFPCKDAALCAYAVTYTAMYVTLVFRVKGSRLVKPSLCLALLCPAFLVGVVRVAEYRNHWSDVLAGFLTGAAIATFLVTCVVHNFQSRPPSGRRLSPWEDLSQAPTMDSPLEKLSVAQEAETCRPHSTPARLTPSKPQNCARRGHLIPSCVSSRAPAMCSSPRVPRPRLRSEPTPLPLPLPLPAPTPSQGPSPSSPGPGGPGGGGGRGRKLLLPTPLLRDLYTLSGLHPSPFHRDNFSPYLFASRDHLL
ncbi:Lipid phosphate phosphatase-related protein type 2 [Cricetulus griseus]|uniref:Phospholipid phosphatase-related protein type 2 n=2 Tax=Cricetulus griseus TaxID=10029 RepID=G3H6A1_CRIGR|nr:Lipid phosphate phosphatase-related protein type 2 [Cricetulus griseus]